MVNPLGLMSDLSVAGAILMWLILIVLQVLITWMSVRTQFKSVDMVQAFLIWLVQTVGFVILGGILTLITFIV